MCVELSAIDMSSLLSPLLVSGVRLLQPVPEAAGCGAMQYHSKEEQRLAKTAQNEGAIFSSHLTRMLCAVFVAAALQASVSSISLPCSFTKVPIPRRLGNTVKPSPGTRFLTRS